MIPPVDHDNAELRQSMRICESDLKGYARGMARRVRENLASPEKILAARLALHLTRKEAAAFVGVSATTYALWEAGRSTPTEKYMPALLWLKIRARHNPPVLAYVLPSEVLALREAMHASRQTFAALLGVSVVTVARWETGKDKPSTDNIQKLEALKQQLEEPTP